MPDRNLSERAEEILAGIWQRRESEEEHPAPADRAGEAPEEAVGELEEKGLVRETSGQLSLTDEGEKEAAAIVRRERLAERLLVDVLNVGKGVATETACKFEHLLRRGIDDEICTLLGHPKVCPHGSPIPPGECCRAGAQEASRVVSALADLLPGQEGVIAYIRGRRRETVQRMMALGAVPGTPIRLLQKSPSYVFQIEQSHVAVDREIARDIYVRLRGRSTVAPPPPTSWLPRPFWGKRHRRGRGRR